MEMNLSVWPTDEQVGEYLADTLAGGQHRKIPLTKLPEIQKLILEGNDPFLVAVKFRVDFGSVVALAESNLQKLLGPAPVDPELIDPRKDSESVIGRGDYLPHDLKNYLFYAAALEKNQAEQQGFFGRAKHLFNVVRKGLKGES